MRSIMTQLIHDYHERQLPTMTPRDAVLPAINNKADIVIGMRRTGKTTFLHQIMAEKLSSNIPKERLLYINFEDERLLPLTAADLHLITEIYYQLFPTHKQTSCYSIQRWDDLHSS